MNERKAQLSEFLRSCRGRLRPEALGLPARRRRRTPGLRREDVAALAGVSVTWYTWLEQGRNIQVSSDVLNRISATLKLTPTERDYLFSLVQNRPPPGLAHDAEVTPAVGRMLAALNVPAIVMTARWDVVAVFRDYGRIPESRRNLLRILLVDETMYEPDSPLFDEMARRILAKFRVDYSQFSEDLEFSELIRELGKESEAFRRLWSSPEVSACSEGVVEYPQLGGLMLEHTSYVPEGMPGLRLVVYVPHDEASREKLARL